MLAFLRDVSINPKLLALVDNGRVEGSICATTVTTICYIAAKSFGRRRAHSQTELWAGEQRSTIVRLFLAISEMDQ